MKRFHAHVRVNDLESSVRFYSTLFGAEPAVLKSDYAKWMLDDPRINFAITAGTENGRPRPFWERRSATPASTRGSPRPGRLSSSSRCSSSATRSCSTGPSAPERAGRERRSPGSGLRA